MTGDGRERTRCARWRSCLLRSGHLVVRSFLLADKTVFARGVQSELRLLPNRRKTLPFRTQLEATELISSPRRHLLSFCLPLFWADTREPTCRESRLSLQPLDETLIGSQKARTVSQPSRPSPCASLSFRPRLSSQLPVPSLARDGRTHLFIPTQAILRSSRSCSTRSSGSAGRGGLG